MSAGLRAAALQRVFLGPCPTLAALLGLASLTGCTSAITSAGLREALRQTAASVTRTDHAAAPQPADEAAKAGDSAPLTETIEIEEPVPSLEEAIDRAVTRLAPSGGVDEATRAVLVQTLQATRPRDWPAVVDEFVASLEAGRKAAIAEPPAAAALPPAPEAGGTQALRFPAAAVALASPVVAPEPAPVAVSAARPIDVEPAVAIEEPVEPATDGESAPDPDTAGAAPPGPAVRNACFASRVRAWGVVDRFPRAAFQPGQEVLVYFELENLLSRRSASGHTTGVDTAFRLLSADDRQVAEWSFPPIVETCHAPRRDYFVRYFLTVPEDLPPGQYRLEFLVSDTLAGGSSAEALDFEIVPAR